VQLVQHGRDGAGEGSGAEVVRHLVPAPGVGTNPRRRIRPISRGRSGAGRRAGRHRAATRTAITANAGGTAGAVCAAGSAWAPLLTELARQLDTGRIYTRDLNAILPTFDEALQALNRRLTHRPLSAIPVA